MTTPAAASNSTPAGDDRNLVAVDENYIAPTFEEKLHRFWKANSQVVIAGMVVLVIAILARGGWELYQANREKDVEAGYAAASTPEKLNAFATTNSGHALAGLALLRLADDAYTAGKFAEAQTNYDKAAATLMAGPLAGRAQLGAAMAKLGLGKAAEGESALKQISNDISQLKGLRTEATYHLAKLAAEAGRAADVTKFSDQLMQIDPSSPWTQRSLVLRSNLPVAPVEMKKDAPPASLPKISLPPAGK